MTNPTKTPRICFEQKHVSLVQPEMSLNRGPGGKLLGLQVFRGSAAVAVLLYHAWLQFRLLVPGSLPGDGQGGVWIFHRMGFLGVDFFFVLSGFIISFVHWNDLGEEKRWPAFILKRFVRIQPLLIAVVLLKSFYLIAIARETVDWWNVLRTMLCLPGPKLIGVAWTLTFEWIFYAVFSMGVLLGKRAFLGISGLWVSIIVVAAIRGFTSKDDWVGVLLRPYPIQFLLGVAASVLYRNRPTVAVAFRNLWPVVIIMMGVGFLVSPMALLPREAGSLLAGLGGRVYWGVVFSSLVLSSIGFESAFARNRWRLPILVGNASYAIYLIHNESLTALIKLWSRMDLWQSAPQLVWMVLFVCIAFAAGILLHLCVEKPLLRVGRGLIGNLLAGRPTAHDKS